MRDIGADLRVCPYKEFLYSVFILLYHAYFINNRKAAQMCSLVLLICITLFHKGFLDVLYCKRLTYKISLDLIASQLV